MPRPHLRLLYSGTVDPKAPLDPRYHPLGQPGKPYKLYPFYKACLKVPYGLRVPVATVIYLTICWNARHWLYPYGARTVLNVRIPIQSDEMVEAYWWDRFCKQIDVYRWGHIYYAMQEQRLAEARKLGYLDENNEPTGKTPLTNED
mmetsp:Transcript_22463/g.27656  ORF Transcript_22463/g.27656 Transcript_22463/m.27656 type:complete len:146 (+) Transcript_22463:104-541(+)